MEGVNIPLTPIAIDKWTGPCKNENSVFILTHAHQDHMKGLSSTWKKPIYCTKLTALFVEKLMGVQKHLLIPVEYGETKIITLNEEDNVTCSLRFVDANHCPGAALVLLQGYFGCILATGDFRYTPSIITELNVQPGLIDTMYLDTSYNSPRYSSFPKMKTMCDQAAEKVLSHPNHEVVVGDYLLGKEQLLVQIALTCKERIHVDPRRFGLIELQGLPDVFTMDETMSRIHAVNMSQLSRAARRYQKCGCPVIVIIPSGRCGQIALHVHRAGIPLDDIHKFFYSEHSSYEELKHFVCKLKPKSIKPIVTSSPEPDVDVTDVSSFDRYLTKQPIHTFTLPDFMKRKAEKHDQNVINRQQRVNRDSEQLHNPKRKRSKKNKNRGVVFSSPTNQSQDNRPRVTHRLPLQNVAQSLKNMTESLSELTDGGNKNNHGDHTDESSTKLSKQTSNPTNQNQANQCLITKLSEQKTEGNNFSNGVISMTSSTNHCVDTSKSANQSSRLSSTNCHYSDGNLPSTSKQLTAYEASHPKRNLFTGPSKPCIVKTSIVAAPTSKPSPKKAITCVNSNTESTRTLCKNCNKQAKVIATQTESPKPITDKYKTTFTQTSPLTSQHIRRVISNASRRTIDSMSSNQQIPECEISHALIRRGRRLLNDILLGRRVVKTCHYDDPQLLSNTKTPYGSIVYRNMKEMIRYAKFGKRIGFSFITLVDVASIDVSDSEDGEIRVLDLRQTTEMKNTPTSDYTTRSPGGNKIQEVQSSSTPEVTITYPDQSVSTLNIPGNSAADESVLKQRTSDTTTEQQKTHSSLTDNTYSCETESQSLHQKQSEPADNDEPIQNVEQVVRRSPRKLPSNEIEKSNPVLEAAQVASTLLKTPTYDTSGIQANIYCNSNVDKISSMNVTSDFSSAENVSQSVDYHPAKRRKLYNFADARFSPASQTSVLFDYTDFSEDNSPRSSTRKYLK